MSRILVLGSSHAGTVRLAAADIAREWPGHEIDYFSMPGAIFARASVGPGGNFRAEGLDKRETRAVRDLNGQRMVMLAPYDRIFVIGHRFALNAVCEILRAYDIWEWPGGGRSARISEAFLTAALEVLVGEAADRIAAQFGTDARITLAPAPYPSEDATRPGPGHDPLIAAAAAHADARLAEETYGETIARAAERLGYGYVAQPEETRAGPFLTARALNAGIGDAAAARPDWRHMNAAYGLALFRALEAQGR